jgi:DNA-binding response OmpR family regulator
MQRVLIVEDEPRIAMFVQRALGACGYQVEWARDGRRALAELSAGSYELALLDLILPGTIDGFKVLGEISALGKDVQVVVLSALSDIDSKVRCFELGACDYLTKPFLVAELIARVRARTSHRNDRFVEHNGVTLDRHRRTGTANGKTVSLSTKEFLLLEYLMSKEGDVCTRSELLEGVWGYNFDPGTNIVEVYVRRVRSKIGRDLIETIRSVGYCYVGSGPVP